MRILGWGITGLVVFLIVIGTGYAIVAAELNWWTPWVANKQTEITRNTNQYVTTQQNVINDAYGNFQQADTDITRLRATPVSDPSFNQTLINQELTTLQFEANRMCTAANQIDSKYVPDYAREPMQNAHCWNGY